MPDICRTVAVSVDVVAVEGWLSQLEVEMRGAEGESGRARLSAMESVKYAEERCGFGFLLNPTLR